jgi:hypothetical protein
MLSSFAPTRGWLEAGLFRARVAAMVPDPLFVAQNALLQVGRVLSTLRVPFGLLRVGHGAVEQGQQNTEEQGEEGEASGCLGRTHRLALDWMGTIQFSCFGLSLGSSKFEIH